MLQYPEDRLRSNKNDQDNIKVEDERINNNILKHENSSTSDEEYFSKNDELITFRNTFLQNSKINKYYKEKKMRERRKKSAKRSYEISKEKERAKLFNEAFDGLRQRIPSIPSTKKLSKIEILRLAICYMSYLNFLLDSSSDIS